ncbi:hypothetical protein GIB67_000027 [Kingdonia uniflora]|uniref:Uncharacterized protein n=1 Tax=Kingdonia uniflora TaxID=39325 RepID=A0A7J7MP78_9MAGN|nr:hypothetical protein GIB67_000027 [Kingdonia uniflora]
MKETYVYISVLLNLLLLQLLCPTLSISKSTVTELPRFPGSLPFELETGYVGVGEGENVQLLYYFVKSDNNPKDDPIILWLTGGHVCSALIGFFNEIGLLQFVVSKYDGSLPKLTSNPYSWTKVANILFIDSPVGAGFSYSKTAEEFLPNPIYVGGVSYGGFTVPLVVQHISDANKAGIEPIFNLKV